MPVVDVGEGRRLFPSLREKLQDYSKLVGSLITIPSGVVAELMGYVGFDFVIIDMEHTGLSVSEVQRVMQALGHTPASPIVRVPEITQSHILHALDAGAEGLLLPHVQSAEEAEAAVRYSRYAPAGTRGVTAWRAARYGLNFESYARSANSEVSIWVLIEDVEGCREAEAIAAVDGIDVVNIGPWDLAASMGYIDPDASWRTDAPAVMDAVDATIAAARRSKKPVAMYLDDAAQAPALRARGVDVLILPEDFALLLMAAQEQLALVRS